MPSGTIVRMATLLTLLLADVSVVFTIAACYAHYEIFSRSQDAFALVAIAASGVGVLFYCCAAGRASVSRFETFVVRSAARGSFPNVTREECERALASAYDADRALTALCKSKGGETMRELQRLRRRHAARTCSLCHALPLYRLACFGWMPAISAWDFAGVVFASLLCASSTSDAPETAAASAASYIVRGPRSSRAPTDGLCAGAPTGCFAGARVVLDVQSGRSPDLVMVGAVVACVGGGLLVAIEWAVDLPATVLAVELREAAALENAVRAEHRAAQMERQIERDLQQQVHTPAQRGASPPP
jgi:hypothetical protein